MLIYNDMKFEEIMAKLQIENPDDNYTGYRTEVYLEVPREWHDKGKAYPQHPSQSHFFCCRLC